jgi:hypothetical protein
MGRIAGGVAVTVTVAAAISSCETVPSGGADDSPPQLVIDFHDLPAQGTEAPESPMTFRAPPSRLRAEIDHRYGITAKLSDPQSGVTFFEVKESKGFAECWVVGSTTQRTKLMMPREPDASSINGERTPTSPPAEWPVERLVAMTVDTNVDDNCAPGEEVRWRVLLLFAGTNGAGAPPRDLTVAPNGYWDVTTTLTIRYPNPPPP